MSRKKWTCKIITHVMWTHTAGWCVCVCGQTMRGNIRNPSGSFRNALSHIDLLLHCWKNGRFIWVRGQMTLHSVLFSLFLLLKDETMSFTAALLIWTCDTCHFIFSKTHINMFTCDCDLHQAQNTGIFKQATIERVLFISRSTHDWRNHARVWHVCRSD